MNKTKLLSSILAILLFGFMFPVTSLAGNGPDWAGLKNKATEDGSVNVIVQLQTSHPMDNGELKSATGQQKRQEAMLAAQENLLDAMATSGHQPNSVKQFQFIPFMAMNVDADTLESLQNDPNVAGIEEDKIEFPVLAESVPLIGADQTSQQGFSGAGQAVAILDTGVDKFHSFFGGPDNSRVVSEACYGGWVTSTSGYFDSEPVCPSKVDATTDPESGLNCDANDTEPYITGSCDHGTHVAGITAGNNGSGFTGVAPQADIISIQVFSKFTTEGGLCGSSAPCIASWTSDQLHGLERVLELSTTMDISSVNMSLGGGGYYSNCDDSEVARKAAIDNLRAVGIATVIASGNSGLRDRLAAPACISSAISVGSTDKSDQISWFSNTADFLSLLAPGSSIKSSVPYDGFSFKSGTSMATPHVAGTWAVLKGAYPEATVDQILAALQNTGETILESKTLLTFPRIQVDAALADLGSGGGGNPPPPDKPVANAGADQTVTLTEGATMANVTLDGSGSTGSNLSYTWTYSGGSATGMNPIISLPAGTTTVTLVVSDGTDTSSDTVKIAVQESTDPTPTGTISVSPNRGLKAKGKARRGPFSESMTYTITNDGSGGAVNFSVQAPAGSTWVKVTDMSTNSSITGGIMSGSLAVGQSTDIMVSISFDDAVVLDKGKYNATVTITNESTGEITTRDTQLNIQ